MKHSTIAYLTVAAFASIGAAGPATAAGLKQWWPLKVMDASSGKDVPAEYVPLPKADKPYNLCVLFPHLKDSFWLGADYGVVEESRRAGVNMTLYEAGGYENLNRQLSQFDDCLANHADAIIIGGVSEGGMGQKLSLIHIFTSQQNISADREFRHHQNVLRHHRDAKPRRLVRPTHGDLAVSNDEMSLVSRVRAAENLDQRGLSSSIFTEQGVNLATVQIEVDVVQRRHAGKALGHPLEP